ncbi:MAG TPA: thioredoxin family protein, partial [Puia sp.]|nr:thioredoxin family protein [Puia sp.]
MKKLSSLMIFFIPLILFSQSDTSHKGIKWTEGLSWVQLKLMAKAQNKFIFVDCYASWCIPCKAMDRNIYSDEIVAKFYNENFINVKVQFDSAGEHNESSERSCEDSYIQHQYNILNFPSFLFFSNDGKIVHKDVGYKDVNDFIVVAKNATTAKGQYYTLLENYRSNKKDYVSMNLLAKQALKLNDNEIADTIAQDYIENYLLKLTDDKIFTEDNIRFIEMFTNSSKDEGFSFFYKFS